MLNKRRAKNRYKARRPIKVRLAFFLVLPLLILGLYFLLPTGKESTDSIAAPAPPPRQVTVAKEAVEEPVAAEPPAPKIEVASDVIRPGDTVSSLLDDYFSPVEIFELSAKCKDVYPLTRIAAGHQYKLHSQDNRFVKFEYDIDDEERLVISRQGDDVEVERRPIIYDVRTVVVHGDISDNLFMAVERSGEDATLAFRLAEMFAWDVDFVRDIRSGDSFRVLIEKRYLEGEFAGYGRILAARFENKGEAFSGYLFENAEGRPDYFDENGRSLRKAFLKAPLNFNRISSGFTHRRKHPVTGDYRPHLAIDYAAPTGTPVKAVGDGTVIWAARKGPSGNLVKIRHGSVYETYYLHLHRFARGIRKGVRVRQGQVIGYVGSTGRSTGPHLDFRMKKFNSFVNPFKVTTPSADSVSKQKMAEFTASAERLRARLMDGHTLAGAMKADPQPGI